MSGSGVLDAEKSWTTDKGNLDGSVTRAQVAAIMI